MYNNFKFYGAWIDINGSIFYTNEIEHHSESLKSLNLYDELRKIGKTLIWSEDELKLHKNLDVVYIALKLGYIRITVFNSQFSIQCLKKITRCQKTSIIELHKNFLFNLNSTALFEYYYEDLYSSNSKSFSTLNELLVFLT